MSTSYHTSKGTANFLTTYLWLIHHVASSSFILSFLSSFLEQIPFALQCETLQHTARQTLFVTMCRNQYIEPFDTYPFSQVTFQYPNSSTSIKDNTQQCEQPVMWECCIKVHVWSARCIYSLFCSFYDMRVLIDCGHLASWGSGHWTTSDHASALLSDVCMETSDQTSALFNRPIMIGEPIVCPASCLLFPCLINLPHCLTTMVQKPDHYLSQRLAHCKKQTMRTDWPETNIRHTEWQGKNIRQPELHRVEKLSIADKLNENEKQMAFKHT